MANQLPNLRLVLLMLAVLALTACSKQVEERSQVVDPNLTVAEMLAQQHVQEAIDSDDFPPAKIETYETYLATIHSFTSQDDWLVNSHIIETDNALVLVDVQFFEPYVSSLKDYIVSLGKPLDRIFLSKGHSDRWTGVEAFEGVPVYAQPPVIDEIRGQRDETELDAATIKSLVVHSDIVDGLTYEFELVENAEAQYQTLIRLPEIDVSIVQDMVSNNAHVQFADADIQSWVRNLAVLTVDAKEHQIFVGRGYPAQVDVRQLGLQIRYLQTLKNILDRYNGSGAESLISEISNAYPEFDAVAVLELSALKYHQAVSSQGRSE